MKISRRLDSVPMSGIRKMFDLASSDSINLGLGEPDLAPPASAIKGMAEASAAGLNRYGPTAGILELRKAVAKRHGLGENNVMITQSGTTAIFLTIQSMIDPGDEVMIPDPGFVVYGPHTILSGGIPKEYKLREDLIPDVDSILNGITKKTKAIFVNSPSNPTGGVIDEETFKGICDIAEDKDITVISDEVYEPFVYEGKHVTFADVLDKAIVINGFSKMMAVTGWRMGYILASEAVLPDLIKMNYHICAGPNMPAQYGILNALPDIDVYLKDARNIFKKRRDLISKRINEIDNMSIIPPRGAFYAFPSYEPDIRSEDLAMELVKAGLICTPGSAFGKNGEHHLRFSYAADEEKINKGMDILEKVMRRF